MLNELLDILYHPVGYIHADLLPEGWSREEKNSHPLLNHWIINKYCTVSAIDESWSPDATSTLFLKSWHALPSAACFIGAKVLHARLLENGQYLRLDKALREFIKLPLPAISFANGTLPTFCDRELLVKALFTAGAQILLSAMDTLPPALYQRARLLFPQIELDHAGINDANNLNLIKLAIDYAQHFNIETSAN